MSALVWREFKMRDRKLRSIEKRPVLVIVAAAPDKGIPIACAVGYLKFAAGDRWSPYFVISGGAGADTAKVTHWCDCLGDDFTLPGWNWPGRPKAKVTTLKGPPCWPEKLGGWPPGPNESSVPELRARPMTTPTDTPEGGLLEELEQAAHVVGADPSCTCEICSNEMTWTTLAARLRARAAHISGFVDAFEARPDGVDLVRELLRTLTGPLRGSTGEGGG